MAGCGNDMVDPSLTAAMDPANEKEDWSGRSSWKSVYPLLFLWVVTTAAATLVTWMLVKNQIAIWVVAIVFLVILVALLVRQAWSILSTSYRLTTQRIFIAHGIVNQSLDQTELLRVDDIKTRQTLLQRILGIGDVEVVSNDKSHPRLLLANVDRPHMIAETLRRNTRVLQRTRTMFVEQLS
jgi:membrane protein YdbS with pleckstrin-like domain